METFDPADIRCVVFDFAFTLCSDRYFQVCPEGCPEWFDLFQEHIFFKGNPVIDQWMAGELTSADIAEIMQPFISHYVKMDVPAIVRQMEEGCRNLKFNEAVMRFAIDQKKRGRKIALVTANMDIFSTVVVPSHGLDRIFDVILNTFDYRELRKECLWPIAFEQFGNGIGYATSLLIEDGVENPGKFRERGGWAYQYADDDRFTEWLTRNEWNHKGTKTRGRKGYSSECREEGLSPRRGKREKDKIVG